MPSFNSAQGFVHYLTPTTLKKHVKNKYNYESPESPQHMPMANTDWFEFEQLATAMVKTVHILSTWLGWEHAHLQTPTPKSF